MLDLLSNGRVRLGLGRGLARREFAAFRGDMNESRERFDEASAMILNALRAGFIEGDGKYFKQPRIEIRPRPEKSFEGRTYAVASSEDSIDAAARLKARMLMFADRPWPQRLPGIQKYRELFRQYNGVDAPPPVAADQCICAATSAEARASLVKSIVTVRPAESFTTNSGASASMVAVRPRNVTVSPMSPARAPVAVRLGRGGYDTRMAETPPVDPEAVRLARDALARVARQRANLRL